MSDFSYRWLVVQSRLHCIVLWLHSNGFDYGVNNSTSCSELQKYPLLNKFNRSAGLGFPLPSCPENKRKSQRWADKVSKSQMALFGLYTA